MLQTEHFPEPRRKKHCPLSHIIGLGTLGPWGPVGPWGPIGPWGPVGPWGPMALGDPLAPGDPWALRARALGPVYYIFRSTLVILYICKCMFFFVTQEHLSK